MVLVVVVANWQPVAARRILFPVCVNWTHRFDDYLRRIHFGFECIDSPSSQMLKINAFDAIKIKKNIIRLSSHWVCILSCAWVLATMWMSLVDASLIIMLGGSVDSSFSFISFFRFASEQKTKYFYLFQYTSFFFFMSGISAAECCCHSLRLLMQPLHSIITRSLIPY